MLKREEQCRWRSMRTLKSFCILLRWVFRLDKREDEGAVSDRLSDGRRMRWGDRYRLPTIYLSKRETHHGRVAQRDTWVGGKIIVREDCWCKRVERQRQCAVIACCGSNNRWEGRNVLWIVYSWRRLSQKNISLVEKSGFRLFYKCWLKQSRFVLRARLV